MTPLILCVDDEPSVLASLARGLRKQSTVHMAAKCPHCGTVIDAFEGGKLDLGQSLG